jgi:hypothetical protein
MLWVLDEEGWRNETIEASQISAIHVLSDGRRVAVGFGTSGPMTWTSIDGGSWTRVPALSELNKLSYFSQPWRGGVISSYPPFSSSPDLVFSPDFENWQSLGVGDLLPDVFPWSFNPMAASDAGIALVANAYLNADPGQPRSAIIRSGEFTLTLSPTSDSLVLRRGEDHVVNILTWNTTPQDTAVLDFEQRTITLLDPDTDEPLVSFGFDEVRRLESEAYAFGPGRRETALLYSADGEEWLVQDLEMIEDTWPYQIEIFDGRLLIMNIDVSREPSARTTIWVGTLP